MSDDVQPEPDQPVAEATGASLEMADPVIIEEVAALLRAGQPVTAITTYRERANVGLREAKMAVERLIERMYPSKPSNT
jgi:ribosomal protein L7/L12